MKSNIKFVLCITNLFFAIGCHPKKDIRPSMVIQECDRIIRRSEFPAQTKELAKSTLSKWQNGVLDPIPVLMHVQYTHTKEGEMYLDMYMSDEDFDVKGVIIKETHRIEGKQELTFEETYPLFVRYSAGQTEHVRVYIRTFPEIRKSGKDWSNYVRNGRYAEGNYPAIQVSIPSPPKIEVEVSVYDKKGHISNVLPLRRSYDSYPLPPEFNEMKKPGTDINKNGNPQAK